MSISLIYFITFLFSMFPTMINLSLYQFKISKEGYDYVKENYSFSDDSIYLLSQIFVSLIPIINIKRGISEFYSLLHFKSNYSDYKLNLLINDKIYYKKEHSEEEKLKDYLLTFANMLELSNEEKKQIDNIHETIELYNFLEEKGTQIGRKFDNIEVIGYLEYLNNKKNELEELNVSREKERETHLKIYKLSSYLFDCDVEFDASYGKMSDEEKLEYLRSKKLEIDEKNKKNNTSDKMSLEEKIKHLRKEKEDVLNSMNEKEKELKRK